MGPGLRTGVTLAAAGAACLAYGAVVERRWYRLRRLALPGALSAGARRPLTVLHLSDLHVVPPAEPLSRFLGSLPLEDVDLVAVTGDVLGAPGAERAAPEILDGLPGEGRPGVAVLGSNDLYAPTPKSPHRYFTDPAARIHGAPLDTARLVAGLEDAGYRVLREATTRLDTPAGPVVVAGLHDPHLAPRRRPSLEAVRAGETPAVTRIALVHAPYRTTLDLLVGAGYRVLLAGHTHGGQVRLPLVGALVANCDLPLDQVRGASRWGPAWLHVSPGLGTSRYAPVRFACRPEATLLHLTP